MGKPEQTGYQDDAEVVHHNRHFDQANAVDSVECRTTSL